jgi:hypothetical protein
MKRKSNIKMLFMLCILIYSAFSCDKFKDPIDYVIDEPTK